MSDFKKPHKEYNYPVQFQSFDWGDPVATHHQNIEKRRNSDNVKKVSLWNKPDLGDKKFLFLDFEYATHSGKKHIYQVGAILHDAATGEDVKIWAEEFKLPVGTEIIHFIPASPGQEGRREIHYTGYEFNEGKKRYFDKDSSLQLEDLLNDSDYMVAHNYATEINIINENTTLDKDELISKTICTMYSIKGVFDSDQNHQKLSDPTKSNTRGRCTLGNLFYEFFDYSMKKEGYKFSFQNGEHDLELDMAPHVESGDFSTREITSHDAIFDALMSKGILLSAQKYIPGVGIRSSLLTTPEPVVPISRNIGYNFSLSEEDASVFAERCINSGKSVDEVVTDALRKANVLPPAVTSGIKSENDFSMDEDDIYIGPTFSV